MEPWPKPEPKALEEVGMVLYLHLDFKKRLIQISDSIQKKYYNLKVEKILKGCLDLITFTMGSNPSNLLKPFLL